MGQYRLITGGPSSRRTCPAIFVHARLSGALELVRDLLGAVIATLDTAGLVLGIASVHLPTTNSTAYDDAVLRLQLTMHDISAKE